ncbi:hypothetical protein HK104_007366, partial [Borealophlyctis nickersoniae]
MKVRGLLQMEAERGAAEEVMREVKVRMEGGKDLRGHGSECVDEAEKKVNVARWVGVGLATIGGGVAVGLTGGLAAPLIGAGLGTLFASLNIAGAAGVGLIAGLSTTAGAAIVGTLFGVTGGGVAAYKFNNRLKGLSEFRFVPIHPSPTSLHVVIAISGWLTTLDDATEPWEDTLPNYSPFSDISTLIFDSSHLMQLSTALRDLSISAATYVATEVLKFTAVAGIVGALVWPVGLLKMSYFVDDPWSVGLDRARKAGVVLAREVLLRHVHGKRPVTLVGYSLGARAIFYCLVELAREARKVEDAYGCVDGVYLFGAPVKVNTREWVEARTVVAGRFVNGYCTRDWLLGFLYRATTASKVAGLHEVVLGDAIAGS